PYRRAGELDREAGAVLAEKHLAFELSDLAVAQRPEDSTFFPWVLTAIRTMMVNERMDRLPDQFGFVVAEQGRRRPIGKQNPSLNIHAMAAFVHRVQNQEVLPPCRRKFRLRPVSVFV